MYNILVSGYGGGETKSIAEYRISDDWQVIKEVWGDNIEAPSYLSVHKEICFAISEKDGKGELFCYKKEASGYALTDKMSYAGGALCYINFSSKHKTLFGASYETGQILAVSVEDYKFAEIKNLFVITPDNGGISRAHCCAFDHGESRSIL